MKKILTFKIIVCVQLLLLLQPLALLEQHWQWEHNLSLFLWQRKDFPTVRSAIVEQLVESPQLLQLFLRLELPYV